VLGLFFGAVHGDVLHIFFCGVLLFGIYGWFLFEYCGSRPAGELLFSAAKKVTKKAATAAAPHKRHGVPI
jgi:hypothetical protein